jgi:hypothetical protein
MLKIVKKGLELLLVPPIIILAISLAFAVSFSVFYQDPSMLNFLAWPDFVKSVLATLSGFVYLGYWAYEVETYMKENGRT